MDALLTAAEVAKITRLSRSQVYALAKRKKIPHIRMGKRLAFWETEVTSWIQERRVN